MSPIPSTGGMRRLLRLEGVAVALVTALIAWQLEPGWWLVLSVLIAPDLSLAGYAAGPRIGAAIYNAAHSYVGPALLAVPGLLQDGATVLSISALWVLHIGVDRALGYGLKYPTGFGDTHLGRIGR